ELEARVGHGQPLFLRLEAQLTPKVRILKHRFLESRQGGRDALRRGNGLLVAAGRQQLWPHRDAQGPLAEHQTPLALAVRQRLHAIGREPLVLQEGVKGGDGILHARAFRSGRVWAPTFPGLASTSGALRARAESLPRGRRRARGRSSSRAPSGSCPP